MKRALPPCNDIFVVRSHRGRTTVFVLTGKHRALWLESRLPEGEPSLREAAAIFHVSERSLQRKLRAEGVTFQAVIEDTRRVLVERHMMAPGMTITQLTFLLGFSDVSSFSRAFRKWYGVAPSRYRRRLSGGEPEG